MQNFSQISNNQCLFCFHCRRWVLERKLASTDVPKEEKINLIKDLERKETEFMRLKRHKICVDDFELLTIIGRGAFGEVRIFNNILPAHIKIRNCFGTHFNQLVDCHLWSQMLFCSLWQLVITLAHFAHASSIYRSDCAGRRNLAIFMP